MNVHNSRGRFNLITCIFNRNITNEVRRRKVTEFHESLKIPKHAFNSDIRTLGKLRYHLRQIIVLKRGIQGKCKFSVQIVYESKGNCHITTDSEQRKPHFRSGYKRTQTPIICPKSYM